MSENLLLLIKSLVFLDLLGVLQEHQLGLRGVRLDLNHGLLLNVSLVVIRVGSIDRKVRGIFILDESIELFFDIVGHAGLLLLTSFNVVN